MTAASPESNRLDEPRGYTLQDLMVAVLGIACALALPPGISWFDPIASRFGTDRMRMLVEFSICGCGIAFVALSFAVATRHWRFRRTSRPVELLILACGSFYLLGAFSRLHERYGVSVIAVSTLEQRLNQQFDPITSKVIIGGTVAVLSGYLLLLIRNLNLSGCLNTLLKVLVLVGQFWGPCSLWQSHFALPAAPFGFQPVGEPGWRQLGLPNLAHAIILLGIFHLAVAARFLNRQGAWMTLEIAGVIVFVTSCVSIGGHQLQLGLPGSLAVNALNLALVFGIWNVLAVPIGWCSALLICKFTAPATVPGNSGELIP